MVSVRQAASNSDAEAGPAASISIRPGRARVSLGPQSGAVGAISLVRTVPLQVQTSEHLEIVDVTAAIEDFVDGCRTSTGILYVFCQHTTCGLLINENEQGFHDDLSDVLETLVPRKRYWAHDDLSRRWQNLEPINRPNGHSHVRAALTSCPTVAIPIMRGALALGEWQKVFLVELDGPRQRSIILQLLSVPKEEGE